MPPRAGLDHGAVLRRAAELVDASPTAFADLSLAQLAENLGVRTPSLYKHVAGLAALRRDLTLLGLHKLAERLTGAAVGRSRDDAVRAVACAYRAFALQHPGLYAATQLGPPLQDDELQEAAGRVIEIILRVLEGYGLHSDDALHAVRTLRSLTHGFVSLEMNGGFRLPLEIEESYRRLVQMYLDSLPRGQDDVGTFKRG